MPLKPIKRIGLRGVVAGVGSLQVKSPGVNNGNVSEHAGWSTLEGNFVRNKPNW